MKAQCEDSCDQTEYKEKQSGSKIKIYVQMLHVQQEQHSGDVYRLLDLKDVFLIRKVKNKDT